MYYNKNGTGNSTILTVHKSIYRHKCLWLGMDLDEGVQ
jgi:hypothetical protein